MGYIIRSLSRQAYALWGLGLMALKYNIDRAIAIFGFNFRPWYPWNYFTSSDSILVAINKNQDFYLTLLLVAIPFIAVGVYLTLRRLKDAGLSLWLVIIFFLPFINLLFFLILCFLPKKKEPFTEKVTLKKKDDWLKKLIPHHPWGSALVSVLITAFLSGLLVLFSTHWLQRYGWALFCGIPFFQGFFAVMLVSYHEKVTWKKSALLAVFTVTLTGAVIFVLAFEGLLCLVMAAPLALILSMMGAFVGYIIQKNNPNREASQLHCFAVLALPLLMMVETYQPLSPPLQKVTTAVLIKATPEQVWPKVIAFSTLSPPHELIFKTGIAYPIKAEIEGCGVGATRKCIFSTGAFVEPITVWDEPRLLKFDVTQQPLPMIELSLYPDLHPPHLDNYLCSHQGQFLLKTQSDGTTLLEGTTWYDNRMWPQFYWSIWSDYLIHKIHKRVLEHIKIEVEKF